MRQIVHPILLIVLASVLFADFAGAQTNIYGGYGPGVAPAKEGRASGRWFLNEPKVATRADLTRCCLGVSIDPCAAENTGRLPDRYTLRVTRLGAVGPEPLSMFRYHRETLFRDPAFAGVDGGRQPYFSCRASRILLAHEMAGGRYRIIWEGWQDELFVRLHDVVLHRQDQSHILAFTYCADGTGGCWQELFIRAAAATWRPLEKDDSWGPVYADLPEGYAPHKSPVIDFETMTWDRAIATPTDPNCCPSGTIKMSLAIRDGRLSVLSYQYQRVPLRED